ncbi:MAG TPA: M48 family metalloprotease [Solirubrobacteraceae bacterium]|jgi:STE24 endopeptidase|nr:M48 family metalloprotease [Solirubrobacteraceae bacterium]
MNTTRTRWPLALGGALATARVAVLVLRPRDGLIRPDPVDVHTYFAPDDIARARRYGRPQLALHAAAGLAQAGTLAAFAQRAARLPGGAASARPARALAQTAHPLAQAAAVGAGLTLAVGLAPLPLHALARRRALAVGLATQTWGAWAQDLLKGSALGVTLNAAAAPVAVALMRRYPRHWWLPASGVAVAGAATLTFLAPVVLDPLFNSFTPLPEGQARADVLALAARAGVRVGEVYEVDASRRTSAANAYVSGLGATKRVVLFDTLLRDFTRAETRLVVAHELAHVRHRDVPRGLAHLALSAPAGMHAAALLTRRLDRSAGAAAPSAPRPAWPHRLASPAAAAARSRSEPPPASAASLPALVLALGVVATALGAVASALSRSVERRADAFALSLADAPAPFISFEQRIVAQNLADPDPPRWLTALIGTHPATVERIGIARAYERGVRVAGRAPRGR